MKKYVLLQELNRRLITIRVCMIEEIDLTRYELRKNSNYMYPEYVIKQGALAEMD